MSKTNNTTNITIKIIIAGLSFWALENNPYWYYQFVRIVIFIAGCYFAYKAYNYKQEINIWAILYSLTAILFNPIFPIYMAKDSWAFFNVVTGFYYLVSTSEKQKENNKEEE